MFTLYHKKLFYNKKVSKHNMAGGFDGIAVTHGWRTTPAPQKAKGLCDSS